jgi:hypothetical protein
LEYNQFTKVFENGGFDVIIGNPPYVNIYNMNNTDRDYFNLSTEYTTTLLKYDLYLLFVEKGLNILCKNGVLGYIIPSVILSVPYGKLIRKKILTDFSLNQIVDFTGFKVFADAMVESCVLIIENKKVKENVIKILKPKTTLTDFKENTNFIKQVEFLNTESYQLRIDLNKSVLSIVDKIKSHSVLMESIYYVSKGIVAFSKIDNRKKDDFIFENKINDKCKPYLEGKDVNRYSIIFGNKFLEYDENIMSRPTFPELHEKSKILIRAISDGLDAAYDDKGFYIDQKLIICSKRNIIEKYINTAKRPKSKHLDIDGLIDDKAVLALLNSKLSQYYYKKMLKNGVSILPEDIRNFPIYLFNDKSQKPFIEKTDLILSLTNELHEATLKFQSSIKRNLGLDNLSNKLQGWYILSYPEFIKELAKKKIKLSLSDEAEWETYFTTEAKKAFDLKAQIDKTDKEIDQMVYKLYDLTDEEIKIVEGDNVDK